jgi:peptidoglycan/xylan/chitin deacetylase (PgdA/CDA1 family)
MLRGLKLTVLQASRAFGLFRLAARGRRRSEQLLILCYHGISMDDEHLWAPGLYMAPELFAARLTQLRRGGYNVLPLGDAVARLYAGTLPPRSVVITFDDGNVDFYRRAWPLLKEHGQPATVYLTTYYCEDNRPIFPLILSYLLWKKRGARAEIALSSSRRLILDARSAEGRQLTESALLAHAQDEGMSAAERDELASRAAAALGIDYAGIRARRLLHLMNPAEVRAVAAEGADVQLHTHRHRSPLDEARYRGEVASNRQRIEALTGEPANHFCYPSGTHRPQFERWLAAEGVLSATTCEPGIATRASNRFRLPRLLDHSTLTAVEFDAWLCGLGAMLPHRPIGNQEVDRDGRLVIERLPVPEAPVLPVSRELSTTIQR